MEKNKVNKLFEKKLLYKLLINLAETTFTPNYLRNFAFILSKRIMGLILTNLFL